MNAADRSACIAELATVLSSTSSVYGALTRWHLHVPAHLAPPLEQLARIVPLCRLPEDALACLQDSFGDEAAALFTVFKIYRRGGGDVAGMVASVATVAAQRAAMADAGRSASAGARASSRLVAALPAAFILLGPAFGGARFDPVSIAVLLAGAALAALGMCWIARLVPRPSTDPSAGETIAGLAAGMLRGGCDVAPALRALIEHGPRSTAARLESAGSRVALGSSWSAALATCDDDSLRALAPVVARSESLGLPSAAALDEFAGSCRAARERAFEARLRAAPVRMVVPLALCLLPAFFLLSLGPFIRNFF